MGRDVYDCEESGVCARGRLRAAGLGNGTAQGSAAIRNAKKTRKGVVERLVVIVKAEMVGISSRWPRACHDARYLDARRAGRENLSEGASRNKRRI